VGWEEAIAGLVWRGESAKRLFADVPGLSTEAAAEKVITATFNLLEDVGLPVGLRDCDIPKSDIPC